MFRSRRRNRYGAQFCAVTATVLLLLSVSLLYSRLLTPERRSSTQNEGGGTFDDPFAVEDSLLQDSDPDLRLTTSSSSDDRIDELDVVDDDSKVSDEEEILRGLDSEGEENDQPRVSSSSSSGYYFDHVSVVLRRAFDGRSIDEIDRWDYYATTFDGGLASKEDRGKVAFGSDDFPVDEDVRRKVIQVKGIEDALLLKLGSNVSPLREGWGPWFDAKSDFLRKDRMFKSNLEMLNPLSNPLLQDPDGVGVTGLTRGDKLVLKGLLQEMRQIPFIGKKPLGFSGSQESNVDHAAKRHSSVGHASLGSGGVILEKTEQGVVDDQKTEIEEMEHRTLDDEAISDVHTGKMGAKYDMLRGIRLKGVNEGSLRNNANNFESFGKMDEAGSQQVANSISRNSYESSGSMYAGEGRWGYFPGLNPHLSFSNFMDSFFRKFKCSLRVFMVWNSPSWMFTTRYQRGLESVLFHHPDACIVIFSETIELDFFKDFLKDGFKIAVAMPNLEELLKDTPTSIFASVWHEWRGTRFYSTHYSELIRLAVLYKYGGIYLDSDLIVLKPISSFKNSVGVEERSPRSFLNGAVMAFRKHSSFIMECMKEFYSTYDDTLLRWNGGHLLTRVAGNFSSKAGGSTQEELKVQPPSFFFPISSHDIQRYFISAANNSEKTRQDVLFRKILEESYTFHFWNSLTATLVPEPDSLVARIMNHHCIHCSDVL